MGESVRGCPKVLPDVSSRKVHKAMANRFRALCLVCSLLILLAVLPAMAQADHTPPVAADDTATTTVDVGVYIDVLANDHDLNPDNTALSIIDVSMPTQGGTADTVLQDGKYVIHYYPGMGFVGIDTFDYTITNSFGLTATANVEVAVNGHLEVVTDISTLHSETMLYKGMAAGGDKIEVWARVTPGDYPTTGVTANGVALTQQEPNSEWWVGSITASSTLGSNPIEIVAADSKGSTARGTISYRTCRVLFTNSGELWDSIMEKVSNTYMYSLTGKVNVIDDYNFWIDDGGRKIKVYCRDGNHGLAGYTYFANARGIWVNSNGYLWVDSSDAIHKVLH